MDKEIWVFAEHKNGDILEASLELICEGRRIASLMNEKLSVILMGRDIAPLADAFSTYGADCVFLMDHSIWLPYHPEIYAEALANLIRSQNPGTFLMSETAVARDLGPRIASKLKINLASGCDKLQPDESGTLLLTRLSHQRKLNATIRLSGQCPVMAMVSPGIGKIKTQGQAKEFQIISINPTDVTGRESPQLSFTRFIKADPKTVDIADADIIVSGGRGVENREGFALVEDLADALDATVAGSRVAVDNQWIARDRQIGQSGKTVSPEMMISCGVSGASAHVFGMREVKTLIAVNTDKASPIMKLADLGVVGKLHEILPELIEKLRELKKGGQTDA
jgi:electron transfer flavoprotein alpha subunit